MIIIKSNRTRFARPPATAKAGGGGTEMNTILHFVQRKSPLRSNA